MRITGSVVGLLFVEEGHTQHWETEGEINSGERRVSVCIQAPELTVPYIRRRLGAEVASTGCG